MPSSPAASSSATQAPSDIEAFYKAIYFVMNKALGTNNPLPPYGSASLTSQYDDYTNQYYGAVCAYVWGLPIQQFWQVEGLYTYKLVEGGAPINTFYNASTINQTSTIVSPNTQVLYSNAFIDVSSAAVIVNYPYPATSSGANAYTLVQVIDPYTNVQFAGGSAHPTSAVNSSGQSAYQVFYWANAPKLAIKEILTKHPDAIALQSPQAWVLGRVEVDPYQNSTGSLTDASTPYQTANPNPSLALSTAISLNKNFTITTDSYNSVNPTLPATSEVSDSGASIDYREYFSQLSQAVNSNGTYVYYSGTTNGQLNSSGALYDQSSLFSRFGSGSYSIGLTDSGFTGSSSSTGTSAISDGFSNAQKAVSLLSQSGNSTASGNYWTTSTILGQYQPTYAIGAITNQSPGWIIGAAAAAVGLGANVAGDGTYPQTTADATGSPLNSYYDYAIDFGSNPGGTPPVSSPGFWSVTVYDSSNKLVSSNSSDSYYLTSSGSAQTSPAASGVYSLGSPQFSYLNTSSITLTLSASAPTDQQFWIPTPPSSGSSSSGPNFSVVMRLYNPVPATTTDSTSILTPSGTATPWIPPGIEQLTSTTNGPLRNSAIHLDTDGNCRMDDGEKSLTTNLDGQYVKSKLSGPAGSSTFGTLVLEGGYDKITGLPYKGKLFARPTSNVISPLTTLEWGLEKAGYSSDESRDLINKFVSAHLGYLSEKRASEAAFSEVDPLDLSPKQMALKINENGPALAKSLSLADATLGVLFANLYQTSRSRSARRRLRAANVSTKYDEMISNASSAIARAITRPSKAATTPNPSRLIKAIQKNPLVSAYGLQDSSVVTDLGSLAKYSQGIFAQDFASFEHDIDIFKHSLPSWRSLL